MKKGDKRLLELADRLLEIAVYEGVPNKRTLDMFVFSEYPQIETMDGKSCGCALAEADQLFRRYRYADSMSFFQLDYREFNHIFEPRRQFKVCKILGNHASPEEVAYNIIDFVQGRHLKGVL